MNEPLQRRRHVRANVDENHTVRFRFGERAYTAMVMTNLSAGGCCVKVPAAAAACMEKGTLVHMLYLVHPHLPSTPLQASVCWLLGRQQGRSEGYVLVGFEFINPSPHFQRTLEAYVQELLR